jgi:hypothetical protein
MRACSMGGVLTPSLEQMPGWGAGPIVVQGLYLDHTSTCILFMLGLGQADSPNAAISPRGNCSLGPCVDHTSTFISSCRAWSLTGSCNGVCMLEVVR